MTITTIHCLARNQNPYSNQTGDDTVHKLAWDQIISSKGITYNSNTRAFALSESGLYLVSWSFYLSNLQPTNTSGGYWVHGAANSQCPSQEPFAFTGNPWERRNPGGATGAGSNIMNITGSMSFFVDVEYDRWIHMAGRVAGNSTKNVSIAWDGYFSIVKIG